MTLRRVFDDPERLYCILGFLDSPFHSLLPVITYTAMCQVADATLTVRIRVPSIVLVLHLSVDTLLYPPLCAIPPSRTVLLFSDTNL